MKSKNMRERDLKKYRWDMVEELAESPGMRSDRPGTTPKCPFLGDPFHVLEKERERESLRDVWPI